MCNFLVIYFLVIKNDASNKLWLYFSNSFLISHRTLWKKNLMYLLEPQWCLWMFMGSSPYFSAILQRLQTFVTTCLLPWAMSPFWKGIKFHRMESASFGAYANLQVLVGRNYSRTSMARTLMAHLPQMFRLVLESLGKNPIAADLE